MLDIYIFPIIHDKKALQIQVISEIYISLNNKDGLNSDIRNKEIAGSEECSPNAIVYKRS